MMEHNQTMDHFSIPIWAERISSLLNEKGMTQQELAAKSGTSTATISDWIGFKKKGRSQREPKITGFKAVADVLGVSTDYLLGGDECTTPDNEEIHKITGLSDNAIKKLRRLQRNAKKNNGLAAKKLAACNYLLESMDRTDFFEFLYNYLLGEFYFSKHGKDLGANSFYTTDPTGEEKEVLAFAEDYSHVYLSKILQQLALLKKAADESKLARQKADYEAWKKTDAGKEIEQETLKMQADYEGGEEL